MSDCNAFTPKPLQTTNFDSCGKTYTTIYRGKEIHADRATGDN